MTKPANRLLTLILLLQRQPNQKAADLATKLGVSVRTLHRYIEMLDEMGIPVYSERGPYGGFSLVRGYRMPPLVFSPEEAVAVTLGTSLVGEMWGRLYADAAQSALVKLDNLLPDEQRHEVTWASRSLIATGMHRSDLDALGDTLEALRRAVREHRQIRMQYQSQGQTTTGTRNLNPYAIVYRWGWWYVIGFCHLRKSVRTFRVDRIRELILLEQAFTIPIDFDIHTYLEQEQAARPGFPVRLCFTAQASAMAREYAIGWDAVEQQSDGSLIVTMHAPDLNWAASTVLAYGPLVEVLDPLELRRLVQEWAQAIVKLYPKKGE
jgi:predicted DNA-binding transcriptional regulator YafY